MKKSGKAKETKAADKKAVADITADKFVNKLKSHCSAEQQKIQRYFKSGEGEYGEVDRFMGVRMGEVFALAKKFIEMPPDEIEKLLEIPIHEIRTGAVSIMGWQARSKKTSAMRRKELFDLYLRRYDRKIKRRASITSA